MAKKSTTPTASKASPSLPKTKEKSDQTSVPPGSQGQYLTTNQGLRISDNHNTLKAGVRGPALLEDFQYREKTTHFDHERIPERVVHARGAGAFGVFECTEDLSEFTTAGILTQVGKETPLLVRFSTVAGSRGSMDTARDVRGFAIKFYTDEGNWDFVGNNIPVFFIHDAIKFADLIHAAKPEPHREIPQAATAHDTFWDFISLMPESAHMIMWIMSDRAIPRSLRMMEGFGVHSFRLVNEAGEGTFVKFHWKPRLGAHGLTWEEAMTLGGQDSDFHRKDLWENIDAGAFPVWDLGVQLIPEKDEHLYPFDLLDPTKLIPEDLVPVRIVGKMTLNRNPDNYFAEIEQVAFHPGHLVPGIDVTNDPLLQGRLFSYTDTQLSRLGGPNFHEIPVNRPLAPVNNNQRDGIGRQHIAVGRVSYEPNSLSSGVGNLKGSANSGGGCPFMGGRDVKAYVNYVERIEGHKVRARSPSFNDHFSQAQLFYNSMTEVEQTHIQNALIFELSKVETLAVRERTVGILSHIDQDLAEAVALEVGVSVPEDFAIPPTPADPENSIVPENLSQSTGFADADPKAARSKIKLPKTSDALSMAKMAKPSLETRKVAFLIADGVRTNEVVHAKKALEDAGATVELIAASLRAVTGDKGNLTPDKTFENSTAFMYDSVFLPSGEASAETLAANGKAIRFVLQAYKQCKAVGATGETAEMCQSLFEHQVGDSREGSIGLALNDDFKSGLKEFMQAASHHRHWEREDFVKNLAV